MELVAVTLIGYRRFVEETTLQTNGKVIAILGPNEAGKTSILKALSQSVMEGAIPDEDISRGVDKANTRIITKFLLEKDEAQRAGLAWPSWMSVHKRAAGKLLFNIQPSYPKRNTSHRAVLVRRLQNLRENDAAVKAIETSAPDTMALEGSIEAFDAKEETLSPEQKAHLATLHKVIADKQVRDIPGVAPLLADLGKAIALENEDTPFAKAIRVLREDIPEILLFEDQDRLLKSNYSTSEYRDDPPRALQGLCDVAGLDLHAVIAAIDAGKEPDINTLEHRANASLREKFTNAWTQSGIHVSFRITKDFIAVHVVDEEATFTSLSERSDGLRQFVALQAFLEKAETENPILLIDEAEQRLHYDAQADLIQMLSKQQASPKIILTTHSAGCLPEDLGNGVRLANFSEKPAQSVIKNKFWDSNETGFAPLLFGMGASTLAFFPTRQAVIVEGASDMLLLPTMFREALGNGNIGFQFVPGLANGPAPLTPLTSNKHDGISYLIDGDSAGDTLRSGLEKVGVPPERIFQLNTANKAALELEDFLNQEILLDAVDDVLKKIHQKDPIDRTKIKSKERMKSISRTYKLITGEKVPKVAISYYIIDRINSDPTTVVLDNSRKATFTSIARKVVKSFDR